jgi:hypothetical protein
VRQVHEPYLVGPGVYCFGVALKAEQGDLPVNALMSSAMSLRARFSSCNVTKSDG